MSFLELALKPASYASLGQKSKAIRKEIVTVLGRGQWVEILAVALNELIPLNVRPNEPRRRLRRRLTNAVAQEEASTSPTRHTTRHRPSRDGPVIHLCI